MAATAVWHHNDGSSIIAADVFLNVNGHGGDGFSRRRGLWRRPIVIG